MNRVANEAIVNSASNTEQVFSGDKQTIYIRVPIVSKKVPICYCTLTLLRAANNGQDSPRKIIRPYYRTVDAFPIHGDVYVLSESGYYRIN